MPYPTQPPEARPASIHALVLAQASQQPEAIAILAPGRGPLTYGRLLEQVEGVVAWLRAAGIGRHDRVAVVLPNGPEMATAFLGVSAGAVSAPLNPAYREKDFEFYLSDLGAKALIVAAGTSSPAVAVGRRRGMIIAEASPMTEAAAGEFALDGLRPVARRGADIGTPDDRALVLHTSGTTSRPKIVPLTHANLCASAENVKTTLALTGADRCLNVMPLFHIHGLVAALLASLTAGGSVVCTPGFDATRFFEWLDTCRPTWYTAVPTIHQAVLAHAAQQADIIGRCPLRFIRSSSSALPPKVATEVERLFGVPLVEAYGMTEAAHQVASNPLPPRRRKPGSVGVAAGPEVAIMDEQGSMVPVGRVGEVVIRGRNVTRGYERHAAANAAAFVNGWFRTGDQGVMDADGYLSLTGRLKEIINRGGEKIAPREIDEALLDHPGVGEAIAFGVPHPTLGEDVAAAVVPKRGRQLEEAEVRGFLRGRLPDVKIPSQVVVLTEIPKGATGKLQRIGLSEKLGEALAVAFEPPCGALESLVASVFAATLKRTRVGRNDNFFSLGGDSIGAMQVVARLKAALDVDLPATSVFRWPTPAALAVSLAGSADDDVSSVASEPGHAGTGDTARMPGTPQDDR